MSDATVTEWPCLDADGPVLVFGGPYSSLSATRALLDAAAALGVPPERMICTGDVVAYGADAAACVALVRDAGMHVVAGNCEEQLAASGADCGCGFAAGSTCDRLSAVWFAHADATLDAEARRWMAGLPRRIDLRLGGRRLAVVHGSITRSNQFVFASEVSEIDRQLALCGCDGVVAGHSGLPFTRIRPGGLWHNAGVIGMPANDGTSRTWFSLLAPGPDGIEIHHVPLGYDHAAAAARMRAVGLPEDYAAALETGLWPSCDVLPSPDLAGRGRPIPPGKVAWGDEPASWPPASGASRARFSDPEVTATGERRAAVPFTALRTLWFNTGTLCNITCAGCYIESSPSNDRLVYLSRSEARTFLDEAAAHHPELREVAFTGGEPFMNRDLPGMLEDALAAGYRVLVLTNAMRPMQRFKAALLALQGRFPGRMTLRVSLDHHDPSKHEELRGPRSWQPAMDGLRWLAAGGFDVTVAARTPWDEGEEDMRAGYGRLFAELDLPVDANDPARLVLFPEMNARAQVPEITESCWGILGKQPEQVMCSSARMVAKRRGAAHPAVLSCTLLPYEDTFELGRTLAEAAEPVKLNHRFCAEFCVLGGASCSAGV